MPAIVLGAELKRTRRIPNLKSWGENKNRRLENYQGNGHLEHGVKLLK